MKKSLFLCCAICVLFVGNALAQKEKKFGHIDSQELIQAMPERDSAMTKLKAFEQELMDQMDQLHVEFNKKLQDYQQKKSTLTPSLLETKEKELQDLQQRLQEFQAAAQRDYQDMQGKLMKPIIEKANAAIAKVGKDNGFFYIFDKSLGGVIYMSPESIDVLPMVKKDLGIK